MNGTVPVGALVRFEANPSAGPARVIQIKGSGRAKVLFLWSDEHLELDLSLEQLRRFTLPSGSRIACKSYNNTPGRITALASDVQLGLRAYSVAMAGSVEIMSEALVDPLPPDPNQPLQLLESLDWGKAADFALRWRMRRRIGLWYEESEGLPSLVGARIRPIAHQIYAARRVLFESVPRFILADEVGLGKTIEAGLVLQALMAEHPDLSVLVIAPGSMSRQWQCELYLRFGARIYRHMDRVDWHKLKVVQREKVFTDERRLIVSTTLLQNVPRSRTLLTSRKWDMVVVDEAHQFPPGTPLFEFLHKLATKSHGFLALSATPSKREITSLTGLLSLVAPQVYDPNDRATLERRVATQRQVWDLLNLTVRTIGAAEKEADGLSPETLTFLAEEWTALLAGDPIVEDLVNEMRMGQAAAATQLVAYIQEFHRIDHRIVRTRRATVEAEQRQWADRQLEIIQYTGGTAEVAFANSLDELDPQTDSPEQVAVLRGLLFRLALGAPQEAIARLETRLGRIDASATGEDAAGIDLLFADPGPGEEGAIVDEIFGAAPKLPNEAAWLRVGLGLAREWLQESPVSGRFEAAVAWITDHLLADRTRQVLVFSQSTRSIDSFSKLLAGELGDNAVEVFHVGRPDDELARVALRFQKDPHCRVLVSDELGGEGRNFQNASAVVHLDLPWSVSRIEQRIGRLDRVGRDRNRPILSVVMCGPGSVEQELCAIHQSVFKVFERSIGGLEYALPELQRRISRVACIGHTAIRSEIEKLASEVQKTLADVDEAFELALDTTKPQLDRARELASLMTSGGDGDVAAVMRLWAARLGVKYRRFDDGHGEFKWEENQLARPVNGLNSNGGFYSGTFSRAVALNSENLNFFAPGHRFVDSLLESFLSAPDGRVTVVRIPLGPAAKTRLFLVTLATCALGDEKIRDTLPTGLRSRALRYRWPEVVPYAVEIKLGHGPGWYPILDPKLRANLRDLETYKNTSEIDALSAFSKQDTRPLWAAAHAGATAALDAIREERRPLMEEAAAEFQRDIAAEIGFLQWRMRNASAEEACEIEKEVAIREHLANAIRNEAITLDAIALVQGS